MSYATIDAPTLAINLDTRRNEIHAVHDKAIEHLIEVGRLLVDTQYHLVEQSFVAFCDTLKFRRQTAYNYMQLYKHSLEIELDKLAHAMINLSVWYYVPPGDTDTVNKIVALAASGKKVTKELASQLVNETMPLNEGMRKAAEKAPDYVADTIMAGVFTDLDGNAQPIADIDDTIIEVSTDQQLYESVQRQRLHIQENTTKKVKLECELELITDRNGVIYLALPQDVSLKLKDKKYTIWYEETDTEAAA